MVMKAVIEVRNILQILCAISLNIPLTEIFFQEGDEEISAKMQDLALAEGALPKHLHTAMFTSVTTDNRLLTNR